MAIRIEFGFSESVITLYLNHYQFFEKETVLCNPYQFCLSIFKH